MTRRMRKRHLRVLVSAAASTTITSPSIRLRCTCSLAFCSSMACPHVQGSPCGLSHTLSLEMNSSFIGKAMHKQLPRGQRSIHSSQRWKHFRRFMCTFIFRQDARKETAKNPLWKVQHLLDELNDNASKMWIPGKWLSINEQTLGFQGRSGLKLRISYKKEGDGFQCDAVCNDGYTFSFYFRHGDPPPPPC